MKLSIATALLFTNAVFGFQVHPRPQNAYLSDMAMEPSIKDIDSYVNDIDSFTSGSSQLGYLSDMAVKEAGRSTTADDMRLWNSIARRGGLLAEYSFPDLEF